MNTINKPINQKAWLLVLPVFICVAFSAILPLMTVVNYSVQDIISPERRVQLIVAHHRLEPLGADEDPPLGRNDVLHGVVDDRHQRQDRREGDAEHHRQDEQPGALVDGLHAAASATRTSSL